MEMLEPEPRWATLLSFFFGNFFEYINLIWLWDLLLKWGLLFLNVACVMLYMNNKCFYGYGLGDFGVVFGDIPLLQ